MTEALVTIDVEGGIADVRLARPEKINAVSPAMFEAINDAIAALAPRRDVRCVVLSGAGRGFSVGIDLEALGDGLAPGDIKLRTHGEANAFQNVAWGWRTLPVPVIAAVHGFAFGAGFQIMLGADIRIAAPDTQLAVMEMRWGLVPDMSGMATLRRLVRDDVARELVFTARKFSGEEGARLGVITRVAEDPHAEAMALARTIAGMSPEAIRAAKRLLNLSADCDTTALLTAEAAEQEKMLASAGHRETLLAAREKRAPVFED
jgi:enoyl-CoA hydratase/carnithine racemase